MSHNIFFSKKFGISNFVTNLFVTMKGAFFWLFFVDCDQRYAEQYYFLLEAS